MRLISFDGLKILYNNKLNVGMYKLREYNHQFIIY